MDSIQNILAVVAHPDDFEMMAGGAVLRWKAEGKKVHVLVFTDGSWTTPNGTFLRDPKETREDVTNVTKFMGYDSFEILDEKNTHLEYKDELVCEVLRRIEKYNIDTLLTTWHLDTNRDHEMACRIARAASRRVPRFIEGQVNYYMHQVFTPNVYVDITDVYEKKLEALKLYRSEWERSGKDWEEYLDAQTRYYGKLVNKERAEGFFVEKYLL